jgi:Cu2+-containing amine oxidase
MDWRSSTPSLSLSLSFTSTYHRIMATASATTSFDSISSLRDALPALHPLSSLTKDELRLVSGVVKQYNATQHASTPCQFRRIYLMEPNKKLVIAYLKAENAGLPLPPLPPRRAQALFYFKGEVPFIECIVDISSARVIGQRVLEGMHGAGECSVPCFFDLTEADWSFQYTRRRRGNVQGGCRSPCLSNGQEGA